MAESTTFTQDQYKEIWDMIFSQTGYPENNPKHGTAPTEQPKEIKVYDDDGKISKEYSEFALGKMQDIMKQFEQSDHPYNGEIPTQEQATNGVKANLDKKYTEKELLDAEEKAFNAARLKSDYGILGGNFPEHQTFSDYKNSKSK